MLIRLFYYACIDVIRYFSLILILKAMGNFSSLAKSTIQFTNYVAENLEPTPEGRYDEATVQFFEVLLLKLNSGLNTVSLLIANFQQKPHYHDSIYILLRTLLSDCITFGFLEFKSENDDNLLATNIKWLYSDHIRYVKHSMKIFQKINRTSDNDIDKKLLELIEKKPEYFKENSEIKYQPFPSISQMMKLMLSDVKKWDDPSINLAFHYYDQFSKYEHLGDLTSFLIIRPFTNQNNLDERYKELVEVITIVTEKIGMLTVPWENLYGKIKIRRNQLLQEL